MMHNNFHNPSTTKSPLGLRSSLRLFIALTSGVTLACTATAQKPVENIIQTSQHTPPDRPYFNDKKAPDAEDLATIQALLQKSTDKVRPATVCIQLAQGSGSGVIVSEDGLVLTAAHVSAGVNQELTVIMEDGKKYKARSLGLNSTNDAAMIQITEKGKFPYVNIEPAKDRDSASTKLGDWVFSLGHSGGFDKERGSGLRLGRLVRIAENTIQSDCTLIGGDSGGPLFDMNGTLIGIHSRVGGVTDVNMHVPIHVFHTHWDTMKKGEFIGEGPFAKKPILGSGFIGIAVEEIDNGLKITDVEKGSSAGKAGIKIGDILTKINGKEINKEAELVTLMKSKSSGDDITLTVIKKDGGKTKELKLNLGAR
ncbi:MAG: S1C family serine protease [Akkermansiaceae bacterium]